jgi:hypothetical protein
VPETPRLAGRALALLVITVLLGGCGYSTKGSLIGRKVVNLAVDRF